MGERLKVWVRSGGCCAICGTYLLEGRLTHRPFTLGELAHIVGQRTTPGSPRGQAELSEAERDNAENLMLLCAGEHDEIDREGALDVLTVDRLRAIKRDHENWIRRVTSLDKSRGTTVLRMIGDVRGDSVELSKETATATILRCDERFPEFRLSFDEHGVEIDLRHLPGESAANDAYWKAGAAKIDEVIGHKLGEAVRGDHVRHLSVFAFARLPLLVHLGARLDDTFQVALYQRHRIGETWEWPEGEPVAFTIEPPSGMPSNTTEAIAVMNVSGMIAAEELPRELAAFPRFIVRPAGLMPDVDIISSRASLAAFAGTVRTLLSQIEASNKAIRRLHVLAALPMSAAVALGRAHDPHVHPALAIYDRTTSGYRPALEIR